MSKNTDPEEAKDPDEDLENESLGERDASCNLDGGCESCQ